MFFGFGFFLKYEVSHTQFNYLNIFFVQDICDRTVYGGKIEADMWTSGP